VQAGDRKSRLPRETDETMRPATKACPAFLASLAFPPFPAIRGLAFVALLVLLAAAPPAVAAPKVVVTIKPVHALVAQVMAGVASPEILVKGATSPHVYALKPSDVAALNGADIFFRTSTSVEPFSSKIAQTLPKQVDVVTLQEAPGVVLLERRTQPTFEPHLEGHHHPAGGARPNAIDGHFWLDPDNAEAMVGHIAHVLSARDPGNASRYQLNATALHDKLDALRTELDLVLKPVAGKPYLVAHDAFQYLEHRYGLNVVGAISLSPELAPSGKRLAELRHKILALGAVCVFAEPQVDKRLIDSLTEGTLARMGTLDPEGFGLEPGPNLYFTLMRKLADDLRACLLPPA
jgi:zinc transport system substrate-binding protein